MTVSAGLDSQLVTGRYLFKHSPQDGLDKVLAAYGEEERTLIKKKKKFSSYIRKYRRERLQSHIRGRAS